MKRGKMKLSRLAILMAVLMVFTMLPSGGVGVVHASSDTEAPVVDASTIELTLPEGKTTVTGGDTVKLSVKVTDASEISRVDVTYNFPVTGQREYTMSYNPDTERYEVEIKISNGAQAGKWTIDSFWARDIESNSATQSPQTEDEFAAGSFTVEGTTSDTEAPVVDASTIELTLPEGKETVTGGDTVKLSVKVTDASEISRVDVTYNFPVTGQREYTMSYNPDTERYEVEIKISNGAQAGKWTIDSFWARDIESNSATQSPQTEDEFAAGSFTVEGTTSDTEAPVVDASTIELTLPEGKETVTGGDTVKLSVKVTDASEISRVDVKYNFPVTGQREYTMSYNPDTERYEVEILISNGAQAGKWTIDSFWARDFESNSATQNPQTEDEFAAGSFTVIETFKVTFNSNGGDEVETQYVAAGEKATEPTPFPKKEGFYFDGWCTDENCENYYYFSSAVNSDITLYAKWRIIHTFNSYDLTSEEESKGGKFTASTGEYEDEPTYGWLNMTGETGKNITLKAYPDVEYLFKGWYEGVTEYDANNAQHTVPKDLSDPSTLISEKPEIEIESDKSKTICAVFEKCDHEFGEDIIEKASTTKDGSISHVCEVCGFEEVISTIPMVSNISLDKEVYDFKGQKVEPTVTVATSDGDLSKENYTVTYSNNDNIGNASATVTLQGEYYEGTTTLDFKLEVNKEEWGTSIENSGIKNYVDKDGKTSAEITESNDVFWLNEEADGKSAWYGIDNSKGTFDKGSRFWVKWLDKNDSDYQKYFDKLDDDIKKEANSEKLWIFLTGVTKPDGTEYQEMELPVSLFIQIGDDWDPEGVNAFCIDDAKDEQLYTEFGTATNTPNALAKYEELALYHFSAFVIYEVADSKSQTPSGSEEYLDATKLSTSQLIKSAKISDKKSGGKYQITKITKKNGKVTGGTVKYLEPYNLDCKSANVKNTIKLAGVTFKVTEIEKNAFTACKKITKVTIGTNVTKIGANAFNGCSKLKTVIVKAKNLKSVGSKAFKGIKTKATIKVPKKKYSKYKKLIKKAGAKKAKYKKM